MYGLCMDIATAIRNARLSLGLTQAELAHACGLHVQAVSRLESPGHTPSIATLITIATALDIPPGELLAAKENTP